jgi:hypothetical protein
MNIAAEIEVHVDHKVNPHQAKKSQLKKQLGASRSSQIMTTEGRGKSIRAEKGREYRTYSSAGSDVGLTET